MARKTRPTNWRKRALQAEGVLELITKSRDNWQERAEDAEQMNDERLVRLLELRDQLNAKAAELGSANGTMREQAAEIAFWVEQADHFRNEVVALRRRQARAAERTS